MDCLEVASEDRVTVDGVGDKRGVVRDAAGTTGALSERGMNEAQVDQDCP